MKRRSFLKTSFAGLAAAPALRFGRPQADTQEGKTKIAIVKTRDRASGVRDAVRLLAPPSMRGKRVFIKPNFNTADPFPAGTHNGTVTALVQEIKSRGPAEITLGERSGPPPTRKVMEDKGIFALSTELGFKVINFEDLGEDGWRHFQPPGFHWPRGFSVPKALVEAEYIVATCCLKTHQYGGVFTMSLKLAVGATPKDLMRDLHSSDEQRRMIAEINAAYSPKLIVMDGLEAFVDGGPSTGRKVTGDVVVAGTDRVAVDAVGVAILKELGSNEAIMGRKIFDQEQIARAVELGLGVSSPRQIELVTQDETSRLYAEKLRAVLAEG
jgi:uncharacterized protein (DUF362 family)